MDRDPASDTKRMSKPKYASLTAQLLARKGEAAPTPQPFAALVPALAPAPPSPRPSAQTGAAGLAALIQRAHPPAPLREVPREIELPPIQAKAEPVAVTPIRRVASVPALHPPVPAHVETTDGQRRHGVTVRLDGPRHRRLMIVSARYGRTYQDILARALDVYMTALGIEDPGPSPEQTTPRKPQ